MATLFSLIMGVISAFVTFVATAFLWAHFAPAPPDDINAILGGDLFGGVAGLAVSATLLWKLWPRSVAKRA